MITNFYHEPSIDTTLISLQHMEIRVRLPIEASQVRLIYWNKYKTEQYGILHQPMEAWSQTVEYAYYRTILTGMESRIRYLQYTFHYTIEGESYWLTTEGLHNEDTRKGGFAIPYAGDRDVIGTADWISNRVWYQIFPERFCNGDASNDPANVESWGCPPTRDNQMGGDIQGIISKLDYLTNLGINALYINPLFKATSNHKYDTMDYFQIDPQFGTIEDLKLLVSRCHELDIKVVLDLVFNHCGYEHPLFQDVIKNGESSVYRDWFYINEFPVVRSEVHYDSVGYYQWMPKLRTSNLHVQQYIFEIVSFWQKETGIDGWRIDVADEVEISFLRELKSVVKRINPNAFIIAEIWHDAKSLMMSGGTDSAMNYAWRSIVFDYILDRSISLGQFHARLTDLAHRYSLRELHQMYNLLGSHDTERIMTRCKENASDYLLLQAIQFIFPGNPVIYYGDELGLIGDNDPDCRACMPWDTDVLHSPIFNQTQSWVQHKKSHTVLQDGLVELIYLGESECYAMKRRNEHQEITLLLNFHHSSILLQPVLHQLNLSINHLITEPGSLDANPTHIGPRQFLLFQNNII